MMIFVLETLILVIFVIFQEVLSVLAVTDPMLTKLYICRVWRLVMAYVTFFQPTFGLMTIVSFYDSCYKIYPDSSELGTVQHKFTCNW